MANNDCEPKTTGITDDLLATSTAPAPTIVNTTLVTVPAPYPQPFMTRFGKHKREFLCKQKINNHKTKNIRLGVHVVTQLENYSYCDY